MTTYVLVHGAWSGGWCYSKVAARLRAKGHTVLTPTLTGQGERAHLLTGTVNLSTHITDVLNVFHYEGVEKAVLAGHSYGGMVISGVADLIPDKVSALVYLDAFVPENGQSLFDINIPANTQRFVAGAGDLGGLAVPAPSAVEYFNVNPEDAPRVDALATPFPIGSFAERIKLKGNYRGRKIYVHGTVLPRPSPFKGFYDRANADPAWTAHALACGHNVMLDKPNETTEILEQAGA